MTGAALLAGDYKNHEGVSLKVAGDGPLGAVHADCFDTNKLRGYVDNPQVDLPLKPMASSMSLPVSVSTAS